MSELLRQIPISSCFSTSKPYLLFNTEFKKNGLKLNLYDPTVNQKVVKNLRIEHQSKTLSNIFQEEYVKIGSSRGYLAFSNEKNSIYLVDIFNQAKPKVISLPPLGFEGPVPYFNVSVSPRINGDIIVAVKFRGASLSLYRLGDSEWTEISLRHTSCFKTSPVMYSERDERFYVNNGDREFSPDSIDLTPESGLVTTPVSFYLKFHISNKAEFDKYFPWSSLTNFPIIKEDLPYPSKFPIIKEYLESCSYNFPIHLVKFYEMIYSFSHKKGEELPSFSFSPIKDVESPSYFPITLITSFDQPSTDFKIEQQLVESSSGQSFIVYRFIDRLSMEGEIVDLDDEVTRGIIVFKQDEEKEIGPYTNDIGDICIFMGKNEAFCVLANDYPGLNPNSVYFAGHGSDFGVYDLSSRTILRFPDNLTPKPHGPMFWIPPATTF